MNFYPYVIKQGGVSVMFVYVRQSSGVPTAHFDRTGHQQLDHALVSLVMPATTVDQLRESGMKTGRHLYSSFTLSLMKHCSAENKQPQRIKMIKYLMQDYSM